MFKNIIVVMGIVTFAFADGPLLKTGQTTSYSEFDDGHYKTGVDRDYDNTTKPGIVIDNVTKLEWQNDYSDNGGIIKTADWQGAIDYCSGLGLDAGGWRLPTRIELVTLNDYSRVSPAIDPKFTLMASNSYWSSIAYAGYTSDAWFVDFSSGQQNHAHKSYSYNIRCARSGQLDPSSLSRSGDIVSDNSTQLQWQDDVVVSTAMRTWEEAIDYCENTLNLGGHNDWRLPNFNELTSIMDDTQFSPAIDSSSNGFQNTVSSSYWSSTTYAGFTSYVWYFDFSHGRQLNSSKSFGYYVRCVRTNDGSHLKSSPLSLVNFGSKTLSDIPGGQTSLHLTYDKGYAEFKVNSGEWIRNKTEYLTVTDGDTVTLRAITPEKANEGVINLALDDDNGFKLEYQLESNSSTVFYDISHETDTDQDFIPDAWEELGYIPIDSDDDGDVDTFWDFDAGSPDFITTDNKPQVGRKDIYLWIDEEANLENHIKVSAMQKIVKVFKDHDVYLHIRHPVSNPLISSTGGVNPNYIRYTYLDNDGKNIHDLSTQANALNVAAMLKLKLFHQPSKYASAREFIYHYMLVGYKLISKGDDTTLSGTAKTNLAPHNNTLIFIASDNVEGGERSQSGVIMHELGHSLGLFHGGPHCYRDSGALKFHPLYPDDDGRYSLNRNSKPHYLSLMNYNYARGYMYDSEGNEILDYQSCVPQVKILNEDALDETENFLTDLTCSGTKVSKIENKKHVKYGSWDTIESTDDRINWNDSFINIDDIVKVNFNKEAGDNYTNLTVQDNDWTNMVGGYGRINLLDITTPIVSSLSSYEALSASSIKSNSIFSEIPEIEEEPMAIYPKEYGFYLNAQFSTLWAVPGADASLSAILHNNGLNDDTYQIEAKSDHNWSIIIQDSVALRVGESIVIPLQVDVPISTLDGTVETIHVTASSNTRNKTESVDLRVIVSSSNANDSDGDGISDTVEQEVGTNPNSGDTDGDGVDDQNDEYPNIVEYKSPDSFTIPSSSTDKTSTWVQSSTHTISGINVPVTVNVQNAQYSIDGSEFTGTTGSIEVGQNIKLRVLSSNDSNTTVSGEVFIGDFSTTFEVKTEEYTCGPLETFIQGSNTCIAVTPVSFDLNLTNPTACPEEERRIQGSNKCAVSSVAPGHTVVMLPTCDEGRLVQGTIECNQAPEWTESEYDGTDIHDGFNDPQEILGLVGKASDTDVGDTLTYAYVEIVSVPAESDLWKTVNFYISNGKVYVSDLETSNPGISGDVVIKISVSDGVATSYTNIRFLFHNI